MEIQLINQRVVVITGASGGIGAALARYLAPTGMQMVLVARRRDALEAVAIECGGLPLVVAADVTQRSEVARVVHETLNQYPKIDVFVNNVGQGISRPPSALTDDDIDHMMRLNVMTALYGMQETLPHFKDWKSGHVINVSSMLGRIPSVPFRSAYSASKHFLNALTSNFRDEVQATHPDIQYSLVSPGVVRTEFGANAVHGGPDSRQLPDSQSAEEVAAVIADVIDSRRPDVYTRAGSAARVAAYFTTLGVDP